MLFFLTNYIWSDDNYRWTPPTKQGFVKFKVIQGNYYMVMSSFSHSVYRNYTKKFSFPCEALHKISIAKLLYNLPFLLLILLYEV